jgi:hypothetical protein
MPESVNEEYDRIIQETNRLMPLFRQLKETRSKEAHGNLHRFLETSSHEATFLSDTNALSKRIDEFTDNAKHAFDRGEVTTVFLKGVEKFSEEFLNFESQVVQTFPTYQRGNDAMKQRRLRPSR